VRPLRLDLAGFTVFRDETTVDFTDADFFALVGPTGSGKSTVLDAICFALYGTVPRWGDKRAIGNALAPSATEARVRLVFESAGARYVASRVVRRDGKGRVSTSNAGLELMPPGFDVRKFDSGLSPEDLGEVLAGTPAEMEAAVLDAVGLPYEQFISCVLLPQGEFAEFLHAKPATRQQILVNLLGLHVYEQIRIKAAERAAHADAQLTAVDRVLTDLTEVGEQALEAAAEQVAGAHQLAEAVEAAVPKLLDAQRGAADAATALDALDGEIAKLSGVAPPADAAGIADTIAQARAAATEAAEAVGGAEEREEKLRGELASAGDPGALRLLLEQHSERDRLAGQSAELTEVLEQAESEHAAASAALATAQAHAATAAEELERARIAYQDAQTADRAAALRTHLALGEPCPVCTQPVGVLPAVPAQPAVVAAEAAGKAARTAADKAQKMVEKRDRAVRDLDRTLAAATAQLDQLAARLAELDIRLRDAPGPEEVRRELAAHAALARALDEAAGAVRAAREAARRTVAGVDAAEERLRSAWRRFDTARDALAPFAPPPADRDELAGAWQTLAGWAQEQAQRRRAERASRAAKVTAADQATAAVRAEIEALFAGAGVELTTAPTSRAKSSGAKSSGATDYARAAAVAVERAEAEQRRLTERRAQADRLLVQRAGHERDSQLAKSLAGHLRANNFERWLLEEALDMLVDGASRILGELSAGQYELGHDKGEFFVIDHHDAGLRRGVRTLSGGETFQASLALALALSEQLSGMSTTSASLESIVLDEGFGTLDAATLDIVAATLENLAARGDRMVGVVTHVGALAERMPVRFEVTKDARSARVERTGL
jgi:exonuclease SbcC